MKEYLIECIDRTFDDEDYYNAMKIYEEDIKSYQKVLEKADSITQSCIFAGKENSEKSFRNCLNKLTDYKSRIDKAINSIDILQEIIYQQPADNAIDDLWLLDKLDGFKYILRGESDE